MYRYAVRFPNSSLSPPLFTFCYLVSHKALIYFQKVLLFVCGFFDYFFNVYH